MDADEAKLAGLGLKQEVGRHFTLFTNTAVALSIISFPTGIISSFQLAYNNGGPAPVVYGWLLVSVASLSIGLSMAEILSGLPCSGGPYFWAGWLAGDHGAIFSWVTGWFNLLGQIAVTASVASALVTLTRSAIVLSYDYAMSPGMDLAFYGVLLLLAGMLNCLKTRAMACISAFSLAWHLIGTIALVLTLTAVAPWHQSGEFVWRTFYDWHNYSSGITSNIYLFLQGVLMAQYTIIGYDSCAHMSEETLGAANSAPYAIILAIGTSAVLGFVLIVSLLVSIQDPSLAHMMSGNAGGFQSGQIFYDAFKARFGSGSGGIALLTLPASMMFMCLVCSVTSSSRMIWSFSRDRGIPFPNFFRQTSPRTSTPLRTVWLTVAGSFLLGLPMLVSSVAFTAVISISTIGLQIAYGVPIAARLTLGRKEFVRGPFHLGSFTYPVGIVACSWVIFSTANFMLPPSFPITGETFNYASIAVGIVFFGALAAWFFPIVGARHWYLGPRERLTPRMRPGAARKEECVPMLTSATNSKTAGGHKSEFSLQIKDEAL